jgi:hypothetical protein
MPGGVAENESPEPMEFTGAHSHGGATGASSEFATSSNGSSTDTQLGLLDTRPKYVSLLYIMRVR